MREKGASVNKKQAAKDKHFKYVIIGNSAAAVGAIEGIRESDKDGSIAVISKEPYHAYSRPLISYLLAGQVKASKMLYRDKDFYKKKKVETILGKKAMGLDLKKKAVLLDDGEKIRYQKLLIATGGAPFVPPINGLDNETVFTFTTWDDAKDLGKLVKKIKKVVVIGAGLIGMKATEALHARGLDVTVVELADRILSLALDKKASDMIEDQLKETGIRVFTNNTVVEITGSGKKVERIILKDGTTLECDAVIVAIGVRPNVEVVDGTKITVNKGIVVDSHMQTSASHIYAAGDVAEAPELLAEGNKVIPIWPGAYEQGCIAGCNMAGVEKKYIGALFMNSIEFFGLPTISVGLANVKGKEYEVLSKYDRRKKTYKRIVLKDDVVVGALFIGAIDRAGIYTGLIKEQVDTKNFKKELLSDNFGYVSFPKKLRIKKRQVIEVG